MNANEIVRALRICARTGPCPKNCPRYASGNDGEECARQLMEAAGAKIAELNDFQNSQCAKLLEKLNGAERRERAAVEDLKLIVDAVREAHCDETCCFACKFDCDTSITDSGCYANECPGFERDDCFEWRGPVAGEESR